MAASPMIEHSFRFGIIIIIVLVLFESNIIDATEHQQERDISSAARKVFKKLVGSKGESIPVDQQTGKALAEELDDGELEGGDKVTEWNYMDQISWSREYPICEGKQMRQSPIDIKSDSVVLKPRAKLEFIDYDQEIGFQLRNTHHSISVTPIADAVPTVRASWLPDEHDFELQEIHFHWGDGLNKGSEHEINDEKAAAEMHMVHYKRGIKKEDIGHQDNSVLVIGVLIESDTIEHNKLEPLVAKASNVNGTDSEYTSDNPANLINLLPDQHQSFYFYNGSLTTPPCYETVTWVIMSSPIYMSNCRLVELSNLEAHTLKGKHKISSNHRVIQPLLNRPVYVSFNTSESVTPKNRKKFSNLGVLGQEYLLYRETVSHLKANIQSAWSKIRDARERFFARLKSITGFTGPTPTLTLTSSTQQQQEQEVQMSPSPTKTPGRILGS